MTAPKSQISLGRDELPCPRDTDGDGRCWRCHRLPLPCLPSDDTVVNEILDRQGIHPTRKFWDYIESSPWAYALLRGLLNEGGWNPRAPTGNEIADHLEAGGLISVKSEYGWRVTGYNSGSAALYRREKIANEPLHTIRLERINDN